jgi:DNA mismatch endonuclease (patch repair protein)
MCRIVPSCLARYAYTCKARGPNLRGRCGSGSPSGALETVASAAFSPHFSCANCREGPLPEGERFGGVFHSVYPPLTQEVRGIMASARDSRSRMAHRFSNDPSEVSARMKLIKGSNTKPELYLFNVLNSARIRFRNHVRIHGISVDALILKRIAVFVDSPFWHLRDEEELGRMSPYWQIRLLRNRQRDRRQRRALRAHGFIVLRFWADRLTSEAVLRRIRAAQVRVSRPGSFPGAGRPLVTVPGLKS